MFKFSTIPFELHNAWREEKTRWSFKNIHTKFWTKQAINSLCTHRISTKFHSHTHMHQKWWKHNICRIWRCKRFSYRRKPLEVCFELFTWGLHFAPGRSQYIQFLSFQSLPLGTLIVSQQQDVCAPEMDQNRLLCEDNNFGDDVSEDDDSYYRWCRSYKENLTVSSIISSNLALKHLNSKTGRKFKLSSYPKAIFWGHWLNKGLCR